MPRLYERPESASWYAEIEVGGRAKRVCTHVPKGIRTKRAATEAAYKIQQDLNAQQQGGMTLADAVVKFLLESLLKKNSLRLYEIYLGRVVADNPDMTLGEFTPDLIRNYFRDRKAAGVSASILAIQIAALSSVFEMATEEAWEGAPDVNPVKLISRKRYAVPKSDQRRWLSPQAVQAILDKAPTVFWKPFLTLILETGMRKEEALGLIWAEVDLKKGVITLPAARTKTSRQRLVPLTNTAVSTLRSLKQATSPYVFVNPKTRTRYGDIYHGWHKLTKAAAQPAVRIHDFRHTFASWTRQNGLSKDDRMQIMGHSDEKTQDLYARTRLDVLRAALERHSPSTYLAQEELTQHDPVNV